MYLLVHVPLQAGSLLLHGGLLSLLLHGRLFALGQSPRLLLHALLELDQLTRADLDLTAHRLEGTH